jgi:hypothetical protein
MEIFTRWRRLAGPDFGPHLRPVTALRAQRLQAARRRWAACRCGFARLRSLETEDDFKARMEVTLRATQGHLELRRLRLPAARRELARALKLARRLSLPALEAIILNNLGIVQNQLNDFVAAETCFRGAEKLLLAAGERRAVITIASNLAVIGASSAGESAPATERARPCATARDGWSSRVGEPRNGGEPPRCGGGHRILTGPRPWAGGGDRFPSSFREIYPADARLACGR